MNNIRPCITTSLLAGLLLSSGCASIISRQSSLESRTAFYPGTVLDAGIIVAAPAYLVSGADDNPWVVLALPLLPLAVVDLGLSAVYDTLFLPHDTWQYFQTTHRQGQTLDDGQNSDL